MTNLDIFTNSYIECALWASIDDDGEPLENDHTYESLAPEALDAMQEDCRKFVEENFESIEEDPDNDFEQAGHDFFLTRNGHGAGFFDGDWSEPYAIILDKASKAFGEIYLYSEGEIVYIM